MKFLKSISFLAICLLAVMTSSCKKEEDLETQLLGKWIVTSVKVAGLEVIDSYFDDCIRDNILVFEASGKGTTEEGKTKCNPNDPAKEPFTWAWKDKAAKMFTINDGDLIELTILDINSTTLKAEVKNAWVGQFTFTKQ